MFQVYSSFLVNSKIAFDNFHAMVLPESKQLPLEVQQYIQDLQKYILNYKMRLEPLLKIQEEDDDKFEERHRHKDFSE